MTAEASLPYNVRIAAALLDVLHAEGDAPGAARALAASGLDPALLSAPRAWIEEPALRAMFEAVGADRELGRRVGMAIVTPRRLGLLLRHGAFGSPEMVLRRVAQVTGRDVRTGRYEALEVETESARIAFHPAAGSAPDPVLCGMREGMLCAIPVLFGHAVRQSREIECVCAQAPRCCFELHWSPRPVRGLRSGALTGLLAGLALAAYAPLPLALAAASTLLLGLVGALAGRSFDFARQLDAVAVIQREQADVIERADALLEEKIEELAAMNRRLEDDVSERTRELRDAVAKEREMRRQLVHQEKLASVGLLAAGVAHEINNPLAYIQSNLAQLADELGGGPKLEVGELDELVFDSLEGVRRIQEITRTLGRFSRRDHRDPEPADLTQVIREAVHMTGNEIRHRAEIALDLSPDAPCVRCRPWEIEQVVVNLLLNAAHAIEGFGHIRVSLHPVGWGVELSVEDDGSGMPGDVMDRIFDPFFTTREVGKGTGLGLSISYRIVQDHGGDIRVESEVGRGTRFTVFLPEDGPAARAFGEGSAR